jgi:DinB family protein
MTTRVRERAPTKRELAGALSRAREATLRLIEQVDEEQLVAQVSPIMSPLVWDLGHIGRFEELWLIRRLATNEPSIERFDDLYDTGDKAAGTDVIRSMAERAGATITEAEGSHLIMVVSQPAAVPA